MPGYHCDVSYSPGFRHAFMRNKRKGETSPDPGPCGHPFHIRNTTESRAEKFIREAQGRHYMKLFSQKKTVSSNVVRQN